MSVSQATLEWKDLRVAAFPEQVVEMVMDAIATGQLRGGDRLTEKWMSDSLGVSRTPMREALKILSARGLVKLRPNAGAVVNLPDAREAADLVEVMGWLWAKVAHLSAKRITSNQLSEIEVLHESMCVLSQAEKPLEWAKLNRQFHDKIVIYSGNQVLCELALNLQMRIYLCFAIGQRSPQRQAQANDEHSGIVSFLAERDADRLSAQMIAHTRRAFETAYEEGLVARLPNDKDASV